MSIKINKVYTKLKGTWFTAHRLEGNVVTVSRDDDKMLYGYHVISGVLRLQHDGRATSDERSKFNNPYDFSSVRGELEKMREGQRLLQAEDLRKPYIVDVIIDIIIGSTIDANKLIQELQRCVSADFPWKDYLGVRGHCGGITLNGTLEELIRDVAYRERVQ